MGVSVRPRGKMLRAFQKIDNEAKKQREAEVKAKEASKAGKKSKNAPTKKAD